ncbi:hypothetical protein ACFFU9_06625 [Mariniflexile ostreae]|uniref:Uncharacterized protein n=1 Tax=Mariniflexile ostreae TaxID=1520892 RepID=A0ABV5FAE0_9FLAO
MRTKFFCTLIGCFLITSVFSQSELDHYKYVIVAKKFEFLKEPNQYRLNELAQFLFDKYGFETFIEGEDYPEDLLRNRCLALKADVLKDSGMFKTKLKVEMKDCNDRLVYTSEEGESREKEYSKAYSEALRNAFNSIEALHYSYKPKATDLAVASTTNAVMDSSEEIKKLKEEVEALKHTKALAIKESARSENSEQLAQNTIASVAPEAVSKMAVLNGALYAQPIENGFQLVDSTPKVVFRITKTGAQDVFLVENKTAIIYKQDEHWVLESAVNGQIKQQQLDIKF